MEIDAGTPKPGRLFVIAAPSGAGKTTLVRRLMEADESVKFSISYTTRPRRDTETNGKDYFFVDKSTFRAMIEAGDFLEHAEVFDHYYGTSKSQVEGMLNTGDNVILEIDWQGAQQVREHMPYCRSIFILPPSVSELKARLTGRGTDSDAVIERRYRDAVSDMSHWQEFNYVVINDDLDTATAELRAIVSGAENRTANSTDDASVRARVSAILG
ncbi:MAG: guanylate kinase [Gammaproteobacteria bacterium]|nr:guanylate kinase [Gammaproteobacteria bacterium]NND53752.1 guanylate kinase [Gammaproteobacteria bacterium]